MKKRMNIVRLLSLPLTKTAIFKRLGKKRQRKKRFWIRPGRTSAWWNGFIGEIVVPEEWRENFRMSQVSMKRLAQELRPYIEGKDTIMRSSVDVLKQVAITSSSDQTKLSDLLFLAFDDCPSEFGIFFSNFKSNKLKIGVLNSPNTSHV